MNRLHRLLSITLAFALVACTLTQRRADQLAALANVALVAAEISQRITPGQANLVRAHGRLILDSMTSDKVETKVLAISTAALDYAQAAGKLTTAQAEALREAGTVALAPVTIPPPAGVFGPLSANPLLNALNPVLK